jgi:hypothetical protein
MPQPEPADLSEAKTSGFLNFACPARPVAPADASGLNLFMFNRGDFVVKKRFYKRQTEKPVSCH